MFIRVHRIFGANFQSKKVSRSSRMVLGCTNPRHHWVQNRHSCNILSRSKGIETNLACISDDRAKILQHTFPFEGNQRMAVGWRLANLPAFNVAALRHIKKAELGISKNPFHLFFF